MYTPRLAGKFHPTHAVNPSPGKSHARTTDHRARACDFKPNLWGSVNGFVARPQRSYYRPAHGANRRANCGAGSSSSGKSTGFPRSRADTCTCTRAHPSTNEGVPQTMLIHHKFDAANVLPLDGLRSGLPLERDFLVGHTQERSGVLLRILDHLNLLSRLQRVQVLPLG